MYIQKTCLQIKKKKELTVNIKKDGLLKRHHQIDIGITGLTLVSRIVMFTLYVIDVQLIYDYARTTAVGSVIDFSVKFLDVVEPSYSWSWLS